MAGSILSITTRPQWQEEYLLYCKENDLLVGDPSAEEFVHFKDRELEYALENGDA